jgi:hypothetical protein
MLSFLVVHDFDTTIHNLYYYLYFYVTERFYNIALKSILRRIVKLHYSILTSKKIG